MGRVIKGRPPQILCWLGACFDNTGAHCGDTLTTGSDLMIVILQGKSLQQIEPELTTQ